MPPVNTTPATAIPLLVSAFPYVTTLDVSGLSGTKNVYYKITNDLAHDAVITFWFWGTIPGNQTQYYSPDYEGYDDIDLNNTVLDSYPNCPCQVPIKPGTSYWIEVSDLWYGTTNHLNQTLNINISLKPYSTTYPAGQVVIFSASVNNYFIPLGGLPAGFIDPALGQIVNFLPFYPSTEFGDALENGTYLINDNNSVLSASVTGIGMLLLNPSFVVTKIIDFPDIAFTFEPIIRANHATNKFWIMQTGYSGSPNRYATISATGEVSSITNLTDFPGIASTIGAGAPVRSESYLLLIPNRVLDNNIYKWNLTTLAWDGIIGTILLQYRATDMLVMSDDSIIAIYIFSQFPHAEYYRSVIVKRYNSAGVELNTKTILPSVELSSSPRMGYSADLEHFWVWMPLTDGRSLLKKIKFSDFSLTIDTEVRNVYETAAGIGSENPTPELIYVSDSCPVIEVRGVVIEPEPTPIGGIYKVVPGKTSDTLYAALVTPGDPATTINVKIPDPLAMHFLQGDDL